MLLPVDLRKRRAVSNVLTAVMLVFVVLLSVGSDVYVSASFVPQQVPNVTITTTTFTTMTSWTTSTIWSTVTSVVQGVLTTTRYTTSTSTVTVTVDARTKLLLHMDGTGGSKAFLDSSPQPHTITANGNAQIDTAQSKFGVSSGLFDGNGAYLFAVDSPDWALTGDFTIDFWIRPTTSLAARGLFEQYQDANNYWGLYMDATYIYVRLVSGGAAPVYQYFSDPLSLNVWAHIAAVRNGNAWAVYVGGVSKLAFTYTGAVPDYAGPVNIGLLTTNGWYFKGWFDEFRVSKGVARWTSNFTPPTAPYEP